VQIKRFVPAWRAPLDPFRTFGPAYETEPPTASSFPEIYPTFAAGGGKAADHDMM
jgi:hypothetical protein